MLSTLLLDKWKLELLFQPEDESNTFLQEVGTYVLNVTM
jgi:hypothetical protein